MEEAKFGGDNLPQNSTYVARICRCIDACEDGLYNSTCILPRDAKCFRKLELSEDGYRETAGCLGSLHLQIDQCNVAARPEFRTPTAFECCWDRDLCNDDIILVLPNSDIDGPEGGTTQDYTIIKVVIISVIIAFLACLALLIGRIIFRRKEKKRKQEIAEENDTCGLKSKKLHDIVAEYSTPCSSGSGMPLLVQRTIARQIEILRELGRGRYGTVMLGKWQEEYVAVKMFHSTEEKSWARETEIYQSVLLRHENILCFVASDINGNGSWTELYLITDYHPNGSLHDYLQNRSLDLLSALKLAHTAACGLAHLHTEIIGTQGKITNQGKPAIAHRDIKSKNILVKADGACCIADMGLAVIYSSSREDGKGRLDKGHYTRGKQGTKRYMSPEILNGKLDEGSFDAFKASDVYSFALVLWEILNCTSVKDYNGFGKYKVPYYDAVGNDPDFDEMRKVVEIDNIRPEVSPFHSKDTVLKRYTEMMCECWAARAESRLTMLRVRKTLGTLRHGHTEEAIPMPTTEFHHSNVSSVYISDRSNSSGFPTESTFDPMKWKSQDNSGPNDFSDRKTGYGFRPHPQNLDPQLISTGYSDAC